MSIMTRKVPSKYIIYLDANNFYGYAMSQYLPTGGFKWLKQTEIDNLNLNKYKDNSKRGIILEVDLEYPKEIHNLHNDYPIAAEKVKVKNEILSDYCKQIKDKYNISIGQVHKLIPTLSKKKSTFYTIETFNCILILD